MNSRFTMFNRNDIIFLFKLHCKISVGSPLGDDNADTSSVGD